MTVRWTFYSFQIEDRPLLDALNNLVPAANQPLAVGGTLTHWADADLAMGWFRHAQNLLNDTTRLSQLNTIVTSSLQANRAQVQLQVAYVNEIVQSLAYGFNALNIPWYNDPLCRAIYRAYLPGRPSTLAGGLSTLALFGKDVNYNDQWYQAVAVLPVFKNPYGVLTQAARAGFLAKYPRPTQAPAHPNNFIQYTGLAITIPSIATQSFSPGGGLLSSAPVTNIYNAQAIQNVGFARTEYVVTCPSPLAFPLDGCGGNPESTGGGSTTSGLEPPGAMVFPNGSIYQEGSDTPSVFDDWTAFYMGGSQSVLGNDIDPGRAITVSSPLQSYLPMLTDMVSSLVARTAGEIIQDARAFCMYENLMSYSSAGGIQGLLSQVLARDSSIYDQQHRSNTNLLAGAALAAAFGTALAPVTEGISALVGGTIAAVITVSNAMLINNVTGTGRDDLGRWKPNFERGWLSGDPSNPSPDIGPPEIDDIPDPPGWSRPLLYHVTPGLVTTPMGPPNGPNGLPIPAPSFLSSPTATYLAYGAVGAGVLFAGYKLFFEKSSVRKNPRRKQRR